MAVTDVADGCLGGKGGKVLLLCDCIEADFSRYLNWRTSFPENFVVFLPTFVHTHVYLQLLALEKHTGLKVFKIL